jgi:protein SCO1/2
MSAFSQTVPKQETLGVFEHLDQYIDKNLEFTNEFGQKVKIGDLITKPTVISLVYYECPGLCTPMLNGLVDVVNRAEIRPGKEYNIITVSFDWEETTALALKKKATYTKNVKGLDMNTTAWHFLTGDSLAVNTLLNQLGFKVKKEGEEFIHPAAIMILSPDAKITRYLNGTYYLPFDFKMAIIEASKGRSGPTINKMLDYCFSYDPVGKKYVFNITRVFGSIMLIAALIFIFTLFRREKKRRNNYKNSNTI